MKYTEVDQRIHLLAQTMAKVNRSFVPKREDDSHTNVYFDAIGERLLGRWLKSRKGKVLFAFSLAHWQFEWLNEKQEVISSYQVESKSQEGYEREISEGLKDIGLASNEVMQELHFEITNYNFNTETNQRLNHEEVKEWMQVRTQANQACERLLGFAQGNSEIRIWPHHFDTGVYFSLGETAIGFGFAMADLLINEPYYYISAYPKTGSIHYDKAPALPVGRWIKSDGFSGAVLPISQEQNLIDTFMASSYRWLITQ